MIFGVLALVDFILAWIFNAAKVSVPAMFDNWGMLFIGLTLFVFYVISGGGIPVRRR